MSLAGQKRPSAHGGDQQSGSKPRIVYDLTGDDDDGDDDDGNKDDDDDGECHHPGDLEVDEDGDYWADWDTRCHGDYRIYNSFKRDHPEGYKWDCCGRGGDEPGCTKGPGEDIDDKYPDSSEAELEDGERHHTGELEPDFEGDAWADWDEDCHGPIDSNTNRKEYPDGFKWSCCDQVGTYAEGCVGPEDDVD